MGAGGGMFQLAEILRRKRQLEALGGAPDLPTEEDDDPWAEDTMEEEPLLATNRPSWQDFEQPETPFSDKLMAHLEKIPRRDDYKPGTGRKIAAGLIGAAGTLGTGDMRHGLGLVDRVTEAPFARARDDWQMGAGALQAGAGIESKRIDRGLNFGLRSEGNRLRSVDIQRKQAAAEQRHNDRMTELTARGASEAEKAAALKEYHDESLAIQRGQLALANRSENRLVGREGRLADEDKSKPVPVSEQDRADARAADLAIRELKSSDPDFDETEWFTATSNGSQILKPKPQAGWMFGDSQQEIDAKYDNLVKLIEKHKQGVYNYNPRKKGGMGAGAGGDEEWTRDAQGNLVRRP